MNRTSLSPIQQPSPEEIFARHYDWLLKWAEYHTRGQQEQAEDLVHELFIQFLRTAPELDSDESAKPYLYRSLHNLFLANLSRNTRAKQHQLSIFDYDSSRTGVSYIDRASLISVRDDLWSICKYACERKASLRAASYFILRFFLEYCPSEIMVLAGTTRASFDKNIQLMRAEVSSHFSQSGLLAPRRPNMPPGPEERGAEDLLQKIVRFIHSCNSGACLQADQVCSMYSTGKPVETAVMAHLVSCERCRDLCMQHAGNGKGQPWIMPFTRRDTDDRKKTASVARIGAQNRDILRKKYRENFEHRPTYLHLFIGDKSETSQRVTSAMSELSASIPFTDLPVFIDITSEQGVRLLCLPLDDDWNRLPGDISADTRLSDGRRLRIEAAFSGGSLSVLATYFDPIVSAVDDEETLEPLVIASDRPEQEQAHAGRYGRLMDRIQTILSGTSWRFQALGAIACLLLAFLLPSLHRSYTRREALSALTGIDKSEHAFLKVHDMHHVGILRSDAVNGKSLDRRIEVWQTTDPAHMAARFYDANGKVLQQYVNSANAPSTSDLQSGDIWHEGFGTRLAEQIIRNGSAETAELPQGVLQITAHSNSPHPINGLVSAVFVVDSTTNRMIEQEYVIRQNNRNVHITLLETQFEILPRGEIRPEIFQLDPPQAKSTGSPNVVAHPFKAEGKPESIASQQIGVLWALHLAGDQPGEQLDVQRHGDYVTVFGIVPTALRRNVLSTALRSACSDCRMYLQTPNSHHSLPRKNGVSEVIVQSADVTSASSDIEELLRASLEHQGYNPVLLRKYATDHALNLIDLAAQLVRDTDALSRSVSCCTRTELSSMPGKRQRLWARLLSVQLDQADSSLLELQGKLDALNQTAGLPSNQTHFPAAAFRSTNGVAQTEYLHQLAMALQLSLQNFSAAHHGAEQTVKPDWQTVLEQANELRQQLDIAKSLVPRMENEGPDRAARK